MKDPTTGVTIVHRAIATSKATVAWTNGASVLSLGSEQIDQVGRINSVERIFYDAAGILIGGTGGSALGGPAGAWAGGSAGFAAAEWLQKAWASKVEAKAEAVPKAAAAGIIKPQRGDGEVTAALVSSSYGG